MVVAKILVYTLLSLLFVRNIYSWKKDLSIPVLVPMFGADHDRFGYVTAMKLAFEMINNRSDILPDYNLVPDYFDTVASSAVTLFHVTKVLGPSNVPPAIIGPAFSENTVAIAKALSYSFTVQFAYGATTPVVDNTDFFAFLIRTVPGTLAFNRGHIALMKKFGWKRVGIVFDHNEHEGIFNKNAEDLIRQVKENNFTVAGVESVHAGASSLATTDSEIRLRLEKLKAADIKIFFGQFKWNNAYRILCQVYKLGMYGKSYVWILHPRAESVNKWMTVPEVRPYLKTGCTEEQYREVSQGMLFMEQQFLRPDSKKTISGLTSSEYNEYVSKHRLRKPEDLTYHNFTSHAYGFDSVWIMALTLNNSIARLRAVNVSLDKLHWRSHSEALKIKESVYNVTFEGVTGPISFDEKNQRRIGSLTLRQIRDQELVTLGNFDVVSGVLDLDPEASETMWIDGKVPLDKSFRRNVLLTIPLVLFATVCTIAGLGVVLAIAVLFFNIYNRNKGYIRKSAPMFNNIIVTGIILCLSTVCYFGIPVELGETEKYLWSCKLRSWVLCLGFSLSFGSMFVKTWRVYKIFTNRKLKYSIDRLSNTSLFVMITAIVLVDLFILLLWEFLDPMVVKIISFPKKVDPHDSNTVLVPILYTCYSAHQDKWVTVLYTIKGILLLYGLFLAYETRNVQFDHLNDSRMIGVCVYNVAVMSVLGGLLRIILNESYYSESFGITSVCIIFPSLGTLFLIFLPKVVRFVKNSGETENSETGVVYDGPGTRNTTNLELRKYSVDSEGVTSVSSSLPCSNSRIMPIYEEAVTAAHGVIEADSPSENSQSVSSA